MQDSDFLAEYAKFVSSRASVAAMVDFRSRLSMGGLGLAGEAGEVADLVKKILFHGLTWNEEVRQELLLEVSDLLWYVTFVCHDVLGVSLREVMERNVEKLNQRYKSGKFTVAEFLDKENSKP